MLGVVEKACILLSFLSVYVTVVCGKQPHMLFILADDYGWNDVGYHGSEISTPNIDKLAGEGVKLDNYYVQPVCTPSRSQLLSGRYQIHTGLQHWIIWVGQPNALPLEDKTIADRLKEQGYATHMVGKWHIGFYKKEYLPTRRGFDSYFGYLASRDDYFHHNRCYTYNNPKGYTGCGLDFHNNEDVEWGYQGQYSTHLFTQKAEDVVEKHAKETPDKCGNRFKSSESDVYRRQILTSKFDSRSERDNPWQYVNKDFKTCIYKPLFLFLSLQAVHEPLQAPQEYIDRYSWIKNKNRRTYAGMVSAMDEAVANVTGAFKKYGLWNDTLVMFSTDNGGQVMQGGNNWPLRGWKGSLFEGGIRAVGFASGPVLPLGGQVRRQLMHVTDWYPTMVNRAGGSTEGLNLDGYDMWDAWSKGAPGPRSEILHNIDPVFGKRGERLANSSFDNTVRAAIRVGNWKLLTGDPNVYGWVPPPSSAQDAVHIAPPLTDTAAKNVWLFDVENDPLEKNDLSEKYPQVVKSLLDKLTGYNKGAVPCRYPLDDPNSAPAKHNGTWIPWQ